MEFIHEVFVNVNASVQPQNFVRWLLLECFKAHFSDSAIEGCTDYLRPRLKFQRGVGKFFSSSMVRIKESSWKDTSTFFRGSLLKVEEMKSSKQDREQAERVPGGSTIPSKPYSRYSAPRTKYFKLRNHITFKK